MIGRAVHRNIALSIDPPLAILSRNQMDTTDETKDTIFSTVGDELRSQLEVTQSAIREHGILSKMVFRNPHLQDAFSFNSDDIRRFVLARTTATFLDPHAGNSHTQLHVYKFLGSLLPRLGVYATYEKTDITFREHLRGHGLLEARGGAAASRVAGRRFIWSVLLADAAADLLHIQTNPESRIETVDDNWSSSEREWRGLSAGATPSAGPVTTQIRPDELSGWTGSTLAKALRGFTRNWVHVFAAALTDTKEAPALPSTLLQHGDVEDGVLNNIKAHFLSTTKKHAAATLVGNILVCALGFGRKLGVSLHLSCLFLVFGLIFLV
jgi:hypothetical protein